MTLSLIPLAFVLHPLMLGWAAAAAAPLIIHLLSRRKYREMHWAAMQYLLAAVRKNSRRVQFEQWLLLALRTAAMLLAVLAVAEPGCDRAGLPAGAADRAHKVIVVDASFSMGYKPTDRNRFERAKELAAQIVNESNQGDGFTLLLLASPPRKVVAEPAFDKADFLAEIEALRLLHTGADLPATLAQVEQVLESARRDQARLVREEIYLISDLGRNTWAPELAAAAATDFRARAERLGRAAQLVVLDVGQSASENLAVVALGTTEPLIAAGREVEFTGTVRSFGRQPQARQLVEWFVDHRRVGQDVVDLPPGGEATVALSQRFDSAGDHSVELRLANDLLDIDNHRWLAVDVRENLRVLCIDGRPAGGFRGAADYLMTALAPQEQTAGQMPIEPVSAPESALLETDLAKFDALFLVNVAQFTPNEARVLQSYLKHGGGLVWFLGDQVQADSYNRRLTGRSSDGVKVLPAIVGTVAAAGQYRFNPLNYQHPLLAAFRDSEEGGLLTTLVQRYIKLEVPSDTAAKVALAFDTGDPAIVEETIQRGRSIVVATSADTTWSTLPLWPSFPPLVHEVLSWAVRGRAGERNVLVGQSFGDSYRGPVTQLPISVRQPTGEPVTVRAQPDGEYSQWALGDTSISGVYAVSLPAPISRESLFAVNVEPAESDLARLEPRELAQQIFVGVPFNVRTEWQDVGAGPSEAIVRRQTFHWYLLLIALGLLLTETTLAAYFGRRSV